MRALVMSDSHGTCSQLEAMVREMRRRYPDGFDAYIHCGDGASDFERLVPLLYTHSPKAKLCQVKGNCDWGSDLLDEAVLTLGTTRLFVCHGHRYRVKMDTMLLEYASAERNCPIALYGHTHIPADDAAGGVRLFNPGAACDGRIGVLELTDGAPRFIHYTLNV